MRATHIIPFLTLTLLSLFNPTHPTHTIAPAPSPTSFPPSPAPPPTAGGDLSPPTSRGWGWVSSSPSASPENNGPPLPREAAPPPAAAAPGGSPASGDGMPFLSSNPAVPLPTGVTDTANIRPSPTPGDGTQVVGLRSSSIRIQRGLWAAAIICSALGLWT